MLNPDRQRVPDHYMAASFCLERQSRSHNHADYEAVMQSRQQLRSWSDSHWPEDDFTLEQNLADLDMHIAEHDRDEAYGFSVFDATGARFLGSLYLNPVGAIAVAYQDDPMAESVLEKFDVCADYWLRQGVPHEMEVNFVKAVQSWLTGAWWFQNAAFGARRDMHDQRRRYVEAGLQEFAVLKAASGTREFHFYAARA